MATLVSRLGRLETAWRAENAARWRRAMDTLYASMSAEHRAFCRDWMRTQCGGLTITTQCGESTYDILTRYRPPALVRALWLLMAHHMSDGTPVSLAPDVAGVYLDDPDAYPVNPCDGCGYLLPVRARIRASGAYELLPGWYMGKCPVCGLDNHPDEPEDA